MSARVQLLIGLIAGTLIASSISRADEQKKEASPEAVARKAMKALKDDDIETFVRAMDAEALKQLREHLMAAARGATTKAEAKEVLRFFKGVTSINELEQLDDEQFSVAFFRGVTEVAPRLKQIMQVADTKIIGHVLEGTDKAHVVCRMTTEVDGVPISMMEVISLKKTKSGWAMMLKGDIQALTQSLKKKFGGLKK